MNMKQNLKPFIGFVLMSLLIFSVYSPFLMHNREISFENTIEIPQQMESEDDSFTIKNDFTETLDVTTISQTLVGNPKEIFVTGNYAYIASGTNGLLIIDISNPYNTQVVSHFSDGGSARDITVSGNYAYVADYYDGLEIIDITDISSPTKVGGIDIGSTYGVTVEGTFAYLACGSNGLQIIDVSTPAAPSLVGSYDDGGTAYHIFKDGNYVYVADYSGGMEIFDVTNPAVPVEIGSFISGNIKDVHVVGNIAYLADTSDGLYIVDITTKTSPSLLSYIDYYGPRGVFVYNDYVFVSSQGNGFRIYNATNPLSPEMIFELGGSYSWNFFNAAFVSNSLLFIADEDNGIEIRDITNLGDTVKIGEYSYSGFSDSIKVIGSIAYVDIGKVIILDVSSPTPVFLGEINDVSNFNSIYVVGTTLYGACGSSGIRIYDVSTPSTPSLLGSSSNIYEAEEIVVIGNYAYVAYDNGGFIILDIANPTSPSEIGWYDDDVGRAGQIDVSGSYAYLTGSSYGLKIFDITNPTNPTLEKYDSSISGDIDVNGNYLYTSAYDISVYDLSNPTNPYLVARKFDGVGSYSIQISGNNAYSGNPSDGIEIFDISNPEKPVEVGYYNTGSGSFCVYNSVLFVATNLGLHIVDVNSPQSLAYRSAILETGSDSTNDFEIVGNYAYVVNRQSGFQIIDYTDEANPEVISRYNDAEDIKGIEVSGDYAYLACDGGVLLILDVSNVYSPHLVYWNTTGRSEDIVVSGSYAYIASETYGLQIFDVSNPHHPTYVNKFYDGGAAYNVYVSGGYAYVADGSDGLEILDISNPYSISEINQYDDGSTIYDLHINGDYAYIASSDGLLILDVSNPYSITLDCQFDDGGTARAVFYDGNYAYLSDSSEVVSIIDVTDFLHPSEVGSYPAVISNYGSCIYVEGTKVYSAAGDSGLYLLNVEDTTSPYMENISFTPQTPLDSDTITINASVRDISDVSSVTLNYRIDGGVWLTDSMSYISEYDYETTIGTFSEGSLVEFYISAIDSSANSNEAIEDNGGSYYSFLVGSSDFTGPVISAISNLPSSPTDADYIDISCSVVDSSGISSVLLYYSVNSGGWQSTAMSYLTLNTYEATIGLFSPGDGIEYYIVATDDSLNSNEATENNGGLYYSFFVGSSDITGPTISGIEHNPSSPTDLDIITIEVDVADSSGVQSVTLHYRVNGGSWNTQAMTLGIAPTYSTTIGSFSTGDIIQYYISAIDDSLNHAETIENNGGMYYSFTVITSDSTGPIISSVLHSPTTPTELDAITISCDVTDPSGIQTVTLYYRLVGDSWTSVAMSFVSVSTYEYSIGLYAPGSEIEYHITATDDSINHNPTTDDNGGLEYRINVGSSDDIAPSITSVAHDPENPTDADTIIISAYVTDDSGIQIVYLYYRINSGSVYQVEMTLVFGSTYEVDIGSLNGGDTVIYYVTALDDSLNHNEAIEDNSGLYYSFEVVLVVSEFYQNSFLIALSIILCFCAPWIIWRKRKIES